MVLWRLLRDREVTAADRRATAMRLDEGLGLGLSELVAEETAPFAVPPAVARLLQERSVARAAQNWQRADELREAIKKLGFSVKDSADKQELGKL
jgi:cysteinyl-tRNA synthetase